MRFSFENESLHSKLVWTPCIFEVLNAIYILYHTFRDRKLLSRSLSPTPHWKTMERLEVKPKSSNRKSYFEVVQEDLLTGRQSHNQFEVLKQGSLEKHVYLKNGEKPEKKRFSQKWQYCYAIMTENLFMTFKDPMRYKARDKPADCWNLTECKIRLNSGDKKTSKSNVFEIIHERDVILFYHDDVKEAKEWFEDLTRQSKAKLAVVKE